MPIYMRIEGIEGESHSETHRNWFDLFSFSWGESNPATHNTGGGGGTGKVTFQDIHFSKPSGKGSPKLFLFCANGHHLPAVQFEVTRFMEDREVVLQKIVLSDCLVTSYQEGADGGSSPTEELSINFSKIEFSQNIFAADGSVTTERATWDIKKNQGG